MDNYSSMKQEFLALKWAMTEKFREYFLGQKCIVFTDYNPLSYLSTTKLGATEHCWAAQLASFDFEVKYRSGRSNRNADNLSRQHPPEPPELAPAVLGTRLPQSLQLSQGPETGEGIQATIVAFPQHSCSDLSSLESSDAVIRELLPF